MEGGQPEAEVLQGEMSLPGAYAFHPHFAEQPKLLSGYAIVALPSDLLHREGADGMNELMVVLRMQFALKGLDASAFEEVFDELVDEFDQLEDTHESFLDSAVSVDAGARTIAVEVTASGETFEDAEATASSCIRSAIHATGGETSAWDADMALTEKKSRLVSS